MITRKAKNTIRREERKRTLQGAQDNLKVLHSTFKQVIFAERTVKVHEKERMLRSTSKNKSFTIKLESLLEIKIKDIKALLILRSLFKMCKDVRNHKGLMKCKYLSLLFLSERILALLFKSFLVKIRLLEM